MKLCITCLAHANLTPGPKLVGASAAPIVPEEQAPVSKVPASGVREKGSLRRALASIFDSIDDDDVPTELYSPKRVRVAPIPAAF